MDDTAVSSMVYNILICFRRVIADAASTDVAGWTMRTLDEVKNSNWLMTAARINISMYPASTLKNHMYY
jgi:hypothetical protein